MWVNVVLFVGDGRIGLLSEDGWGLCRSRWNGCGAGVALG